jgi:hypothetical protein
VIGNQRVRATTSCRIRLQQVLSVSAEVDALGEITKEVA